MEQLIALLERDPARIASLLARPESWRQPAAEPALQEAQIPLPRVASGALRFSAARIAKPGVAPVTQTDERPLKLYQPAHQRHYLVSASLVCATPGLPDRALDTDGAEPVHFVLRRMLSEGGPNEPPTEYAYVAEGGTRRWQRVGRGDEARRAVAGEEPLPLFGLSFRDDAARPRRLWTGSVPVGRREEYLGADVSRSTAPLLAQALRDSASLAPPVAAPASVGSRKLGRVTQFQMEVAEPWKTMVRASVQTARGIGEEAAAGGDPEPVDAKSKRAQDFNLQQQHISWLVLLDFASYLASHFSSLWTVVQSEGVGLNDLPQRQQSLYQLLAGASATPELALALQPVNAQTAARTLQPSLAAALKAVGAPGVAALLEAQRMNYERSSSTSSDWPTFHFLLAGIDSNRQAAGPYKTLPLPDAPADAMPDDQVALDANREASRIDHLTAQIGLALPDEGDAQAPPLPYALKLKNAMLGTAGDSGLFVVRFVHQRLDCGPLHAPVVSAASEPFQLASFFDSDAPARPIRITLPADTSPAGLRKFNKNTAFVLSDMLCGQVQRAKGLGFIDLVRAVLPWPLHKDLDAGSGSCKSGGLDVGMICSLSIPIITICALILLIIIVTLLDLIFRWLPFFVMCFPLPGLKGKK